MVLVDQQDEEPLPDFVRTLCAKMGNVQLDASTARSALCISNGLRAATAEHMPVSAASAAAQRQMYLDYLGRDALEELASHLTLGIQHVLDCARLDSCCGPLNVKIGDGPWVHGVRAGAVLTLGRHPRCGLQMADAGYVSRLQCIVVRACGRLVVYDMCSLMGTEATAIEPPTVPALDLPDGAVYGERGGRGERGERSSPAPRRSGPDGRMLLVFPWGVGAEVRLAVRCETEAVVLHLRESSMRNLPVPSPVTVELPTPATPTMLSPASLSSAQRLTTKHLPLRPTPRHLPPRTAYLVGDGVGNGRGKAAVRENDVDAGEAGVDATRATKAASAICAAADDGACSTALESLPDDLLWRVARALIDDLCGGATALVQLSRRWRSHSEPSLP